MSYIGVDLGGTRIKIGVVNDNGLVASAIIDAHAESGLAQNLPRIKQQIQTLLQKTGLESFSIGVAFPGLVNTDLNRVIGVSGKYADAEAINLVKWAKEELEMDLKLENDARLACLGEWRFGAGKGSSDLVICTLGTGIGTSAIINGQIVRGKHYQAGILGGHSIINYAEKSRACSCGNYGCVESLASTWVMKEFTKHNPLFDISALKGAPEIDFAAIFECSQQGDALAIQLRDHCMEVWGVGIVNLIHAYDPDVVIIGGGIARSKDVLVPYFNQIIRERAWTPWGTPEVRIAEFPDTAALLGAPLLFN